MYLKTFFFLVTIGVCLPCSGLEITHPAPGAVLDEQSGGAKDDGVIKLAPFVVEASSRARLRVDFKYHIFGAHLRSLTFTEITADWAKAGIKVGDRVTKIDGRPIDGMRLVHDFFALLKEKFAPLKSKKVSEVPIVFEIQSSDSNTTKSIKVIMKSSTPLCFYNYGF